MVVMDWPIFWTKPGPKGFEEKHQLLVCQQPTTFLAKLWYIGDDPRVPNDNDNDILTMDLWSKQLLDSYLRFNMV